MKTVRRLYFYAVALISLEVVLWGVIGLLRTVVNNLSIGSVDALTRALALVLVGVPIFLIHWGWAQNAASRDEEEHTASLRAVFLYAALLGTLVPVVQNLLALINRLFLQASSMPRASALLGASQTTADNLIAIGMNLLVAWYIWTVLKKDWATLPDTENFSDIRRLYRYIWLLYSLLMTVIGVQQVIRFSFNIPTQVVGTAQPYLLVNGLALLAVGLPIWLYTWNLCQSALSEPGERGSVLRLGVLYLLALGGVIAVLASGGAFLYQILSQILGAGVPWQDLITNIGGPISVALPLGVVWAYYGSWLDRHIESVAEGERRAALKRPYLYILSFIGLAAAFTGAALLIRAIISMGLAQQLVSSDPLLGQTARALAALAVGLPLWLMVWRRVDAQARTEAAQGTTERRSVVRRGYLYLVLFISVIGGMAAAVSLVFRLLSALLGGDAGGNFAAEVLNSFQLLVLFGVVLTYHLLVLRRDGASKAGEEAAGPAEFPVLILDPGRGDFAAQARQALEKGGSGLRVAVLGAAEPAPDGAAYKAVVLPASLALDPPSGLKPWLDGFDGRRIIVPDEPGGAILAGDTREAARLARRLADGHEVPAGRIPQSGWMIAIYVMAALFALQILFFVFALGISSFVD